MVVSDMKETKSRAECWRNPGLAYEVPLGFTVHLAYPRVAPARRVLGRISLTR